MFMQLPPASSITNKLQQSKGRSGIIHCRMSWTSKSFNLAGWWHRRRVFVFPAFISVSGGPKMNLAEVIHASWVKRDQGHLSLFDAAHADAWDNILLEVEYKAFCGRFTRWNGSFIRRQSPSKNLKRGKKGSCPWSGGWTWRHHRQRKNCIANSPNRAIQFAIRQV